MVKKMAYRMYSLNEYIEQVYLNQKLHRLYRAFLVAIRYTMSKTNRLM